MELKIEKNKYSPAEVALLGIFAFGLLLSALLVSNRNKISFSNPIIAPFDGLSISMPFGRGWHGHGKWQYSGVDNAFVLQSILKKSSMGIAQVSWQYYLAPEEKDFNELMNDISKEGGFKSVKAGDIKIGKLLFSKMIFSSPSKEHPDGIEDCYYAICKLPFSRELKLEVRTAGDAELAERVFEAAIKEIQYSEDPRLAGGNDFIKKVKQAGAQAIIKRETAENFKRFYLIKKNSGKNAVSRNGKMTGYRGFSMELFSPAGNISGGGATASTLYYLDGANGWTGSSLFNCDKSMANFHWQTKQRSLDNRISNGVELEYANGVLRCFDLQNMAETTQKERVFFPSSLAVAELFLESLTAAFLDQDIENVLVDLILPDGKIVPAEISNVTTDKKLSAIKTDQTVRLTLYDSPENYYDVLFDKTGNIIGKTEHSREVFELKKTGIEEIIELFEGHRYDIEKMLK